MDGAPLNVEKFDDGSLDAAADDDEMLLLLPLLLLYFETDEDDELLVSLSFSSSVKSRRSFEAVVFFRYFIVFCLPTTALL